MGPGGYVLATDISYHDTGDSRKAVEIQRQALELASESDPERAELVEHLALFEKALDHKE